MVFPISRDSASPVESLLKVRPNPNPGPDVKSLRLSFRSDPDTGLIPGPATPADDGSFLVQPLYPAPTRILVNPALQNAYVKSIRFEEREVL